MHHKSVISAAFVAVILSGCAPHSSGPSISSQQQTNPARSEPHVFKPIEFKYDPKKPEATNFAKQLDLPIFQCELEASTGNMAVKYGNKQGIAEYSDSLIACSLHARKEGDAAIARLRTAKVPAKQAELAKALYAKWSAYLQSMNPYSRPDIIAKTDYRSAKEALATELKFSE